jgi:hypothetical protein
VCERKVYPVTSRAQFEKAGAEGRCVRVAAGSELEKGMRQAQRRPRHAAEQLDSGGRSNGGASSSAVLPSPFGASVASPRHVVIVSTQPAVNAEYSAGVPSGVDNASEILRGVASQLTGWKALRYLSRDVFVAGDSDGHVIDLYCFVVRVPKAPRGATKSQIEQQHPARDDGPLGKNNMPSVGGWSYFVTADADANEWFADFASFKLSPLGALHSGSRFAMFRPSPSSTASTAAASATAATAAFSAGDAAISCAEGTFQQLQSSLLEVQSRIVQFAQSELFEIQEPQFMGEMMPSHYTSSSPVQLILDDVEDDTAVIS